MQYYLQLFTDQGNAFASYKGTCIDILGTRTLTNLQVFESVIAAIKQMQFDEGTNVQMAKDGLPLPDGTRAECKHEPDTDSIHRCIDGAFGKCIHCDKDIEYITDSTNDYWILADKSESNKAFKPTLTSYNEGRDPIELPVWMSRVKPKGYGDRHPHADLIHLWAEGAEIESLSYILNSEWQKSDYPYWHPDFKYRIAEPEVTKPNINWEHVHPAYNWLCSDEDGDYHLYINKPRLAVDIGEWYVDEPACWAATHTSFKPGTCNWDKSLICRPGVDSDD